MTHAKAGHSLAGSCFWSLAAAGFPDYDGYKVNLVQKEAHVARRSQLGAATKSSMPGKAGGQRGQRAAAKPRRQPGTDGESTGEALDAQTHAELDASGECASTGACLPPPDEAASSSQQGIWRVSSAAQERCEAAAGMFNDSAQQAEQDACEQDAQTVALIRRHAKLVMALNAPEAVSRECLLM